MTENNDAIQIEIRKCRSNLRIIGMGTMIFAVWAFFKGISMMFSELMSFTVLFMIIGILIRVHAGRNAIGFSRGKRKKLSGGAKFIFKKDFGTMNVEQFVMAYEIEQDRIRALLPDGYRSLRPVLRINTEIRDDSLFYVEFNTPVEAGGKRGWLNIANWDSTSDRILYSEEFSESGDGRRITVTLEMPFLKVEYTGTGLEGGCPAEKDNDGCWFMQGEETEFRPAEAISENKEFCDCSFSWRFNPGDAQGMSQGKTLPAYDTPQEMKYERKPLTAESAAAIPCRQVLGAYIVRFSRTEGTKTD